MLTMIDSMGGINPNGVGTDYGTCTSFVDGHMVFMSFDHLDELQEISQKIGFDVIDGYNTKAVCVKASMTKINGDKWYKVSAYYYKGVRKHGYIHAEYVDVD